MNLQVAGFIDNSLANGTRQRSVLFVSGCKHNCKGCHNKDMQAYDFGQVNTVEEVVQMIKNNIPIIKGVTFSGGEPFDQAEALIEVAKEVKKLGLDIWSYTGYTIEYLRDSGDKFKRDLLEYIDVLVDGPFIESLPTNTRYIGSNNQRIIYLR